MAEVMTRILKCVLISRWFVVLNFPPLKMFKSSNSSLIFHMNFKVLCTLLSLFKNFLVCS